MSVLISSVTANFSNAQFAYSGIGLNIRDNGSSNASKLLHITANNDARLTIFKDGGMRLRSNVSANSDFDGGYFFLRPKTDILNVDSQLMVKRDWLEENKDFSSEINTHDTAYAEEYEYVRTSNGSVFLNLSNATSFRVESTTNTITKLMFIKPTDTHTIKNRVYSCFVMFSGINSINPSVWTNAGIVWLDGVAPPAATNQTLLLSFYSPNITEYPAINNIWYGTGGS